jgi:hypothetical protein
VFRRDTRPSGRCRSRGSGASLRVPGRRGQYVGTAPEGPVH